MKRPALLIALLLVLLGVTNYLTYETARSRVPPEAPVYPPPPPYEGPRDPLVREKLAWWQDLKFGLMMHWGPYSQWGVVESWSICSEDEPWCRRPTNDYVQYVKDYENLQTTFNPVAFDPDRWAEAAAYAGMRYVVFTTKHHDGFSMFDTRHTDYRITGEETPFSSHPRANVTREIFDAFRARDFGIGVYFSKPDWHHDDYWAPDWATPDRNVNYDTAKYPERWQRFNDFTYNQLEELMTGYGPVDILWLDGGWVRPRSTITSDVAAWCKSPYEQDVDMARIATMARGHQPGLIIVDRTVAGPYEDYRTPEQHVPEEPLDFPWETCMTMASSWSYNPDDAYKPTRTLIHYLVDIVSKGGNYLLNIGPSPEGDYHPDAYRRLREIGDWMQVNSEAIYGTNPIAPYQDGPFRFTAREDGTVYGIFLAEEDQATMPAEVALHGIRLAPESTLTLLGTDQPLSWETDGPGVRIQIPDALQRTPPADHAWVFKGTLE